MSQKRRRAERFGRLAETYAALFLFVKGYIILGRRLRTPFGEVDMAARKGGVFVIVEVKARHNARDALYSVGLAQQQRLARAGLYLADHWRLTACPMRFDVIVVGAAALPQHVQAAWSPGG